MSEPFVLKQKRSAYKQRDARPVARLTRYAFDKCADWAEATGIPMSQIIDQCVRYCEKNLEWEEQT